MARKRFPHGALDGGEDLRLVAEPDFLLRRVGVHVDHLGRHHEVEHGDGSPAHGQRVAVALLDGVGKVAVLDPAAVDGHRDVVAIRAVQVGVADVAGDVHVVGVEQDGQHLAGHVVAHDAEDGFLELAGAVGAEGFVAVVGVREAYVVGRPWRSGPRCAGRGRLRWASSAGT